MFSSTLHTRAHCNHANLLLALFNEKWVVEPVSTQQFNILIKPPCCNSGYAIIFVEVCFVVVFNCLFRSTKLFYTFSASWCCQCIMVVSFSIGLQCLFYSSHQSQCKWCWFICKATQCVSVLLVGPWTTLWLQLWLALPLDCNVLGLLHHQHNFSH